MNSKPLIGNGSSCGITDGLVHSPHWAQYGYHLQVISEDERGIIQMTTTGMSARDVGERALLVFVIHIRSTEMVAFTGLTKTAICPSPHLTKSIRDVVRMIDDMMPSV